MLCAPMFFEIHRRAITAKNSFMTVGATRANLPSRCSLFPRKQVPRKQVPFHKIRTRKTARL
jgi:hypothetical protein